MLEIKLDTSQFDRELSSILQRLQNPSSLMAAVAQSMESQTQQAFYQEGQPGGGKWKDLDDSTKSQRAKEGSWPGPILNRSGGSGLLGSVMSASTSVTATVGAGSGKSAAYAAIHQFGGKTKTSTIRPKKKRALAFDGRVVGAVKHPGSNIPARPYLPITGAGFSASLTPHAEKAITRMALKFIETGQL